MGGLEDSRLGEVQVVLKRLEEKYRRKIPAWEDVRAQRFLIPSLLEFFFKEILTICLVRSFRWQRKHSARGVENMREGRKKLKNSLKNKEKHKKKKNQTHLLSKLESATTWRLSREDPSLTCRNRTSFWDRTERTHPCKEGLFNMSSKTKHFYIFITCSKKD